MHIVYLSAALHRSVPSQLAPSGWSAWALLDRPQLAVICERNFHADATASISAEWIGESRQAVEEGHEVSLDDRKEQGAFRLRQVG